MAINLGSTAITDAKLGTTQVEKIYLGSEQVWGGSPTPTDPQYGEVVLYGYSVTQTVIDNVTGGTVTIVDEQTFAQAFMSASFPLTITISGDDPTDFLDWEVTTNPSWAYVDTYDLGRSISITTESTPFTLQFRVVSLKSTVIDKSVTNTVTLASVAEFNQYTCSASNGLMQNDVPITAVKEFRVGSDITSTPNEFLQWATNLDSFSFATDSHLTTIGNYFLAHCGIDQPIAVPSGVASIGNYFLYACTVFNSLVTFPNTLTAIGSNLIGASTKFNQPVTIPNSVTTLFAWAFSGCTSLNQPITLSNGLSSLTTSFMYSCKAFNSTVNLPSALTSIGGGFMDGCSAFNHSLTIPSTVTQIGDRFLASCKAFNQPLTIPSSVTSIGSSFMESCTVFAQPLSLPAGCEVIKASFMYECQNFTQLNVSSSTLGGQTALHNQTLATRTQTAKIYTTGVTLTGANRALWLSTFPNSTAKPFRKLIDGGA